LAFPSPDRGLAVADHLAVSARAGHVLGGAGVLATSHPGAGQGGLAFLVALCAQAVLGDQPVVSVNSRRRWALLQQVGVGLAVGFAVRLVMAAVKWPVNWWACRWA
jgi:flagellar biosynthesis protein FliR